MSKFCINCGSMVDETEIFCRNCGANVTADTSVNNMRNTNINGNSNNAPAKTSPVAIAGFVLSLVGIFCGCIFAILGITFGVVAKQRIKAFNEGGNGLATAAIVIGIVDIVLNLGLVVLNVFLELI